MKLKKWDIIVFEYEGELQVGYIDSFASICTICYFGQYKSVTNLIHKYGVFESSFSDFKHIHKIGTMPKCWR